MDGSLSAKLAECGRWLAAPVPARYASERGDGKRTDDLRRISDRELHRWIALALDRAGHPATKATKAAPVADKPLAEMSIDELQARVTQLKAERAEMAEPVSNGVIAAK
jgi:hypothetical protein